MIAKIACDSVELWSGQHGDYTLLLRVNNSAKYPARELETRLKGENKPIVAVFDFAKKSRTVDQNSMLWGLLTELADGLNAGKKDPEITPDSLYIQALTKYGFATFLYVDPAAVEDLKRAYRDIKIIDKTEVNGKEMVIVKATYGSSTYSTKEMSVLIEGVLDDLAQAGIDTDTTRCLTAQWRGYNL